MRYGFGRTGSGDLDQAGWRIGSSRSVERGREAPTLAGKIGVGRQYGEGAVREMAWWTTCQTVGSAGRPVVNAGGAVGRSDMAGSRWHNSVGRAPD
jgi:hypothetical protein